MESTLEVRWFVRGKPSAAEQHWFESDCLGESLGWEKRQDWYAYFPQSCLDELTNCLDRQFKPQEINLKLRQGNLELKLRQQKSEIGIDRSKDSYTCQGKIEQWHKFTPPELNQFGLLPNKLLDRLDWMGVYKERQQKIERGVKSELTYLKVDRQHWWSLAFEMTQSDRGNNSCFEEVVATCQKYCKPNLSAVNSYGYSEWLLKQVPKTVPYREINVSK